ncbi:PepSY domain-containing protein [Streptomyces sp. HMX112]|uniref:PepSY domain-containing protein n=1 Tax=Streptomyces sp. HMX112 TaxID=3390850 RepID=UPI003A80F49E
MKRNLIIATVATAALLTGGTAAAFAASADDDAPADTGRTAASAPAADSDNDDDRDEAPDASDTAEAQRSLKDAKVTAGEALKAVAGHGTVLSLDLDGKSWEVELVTKDGKLQDWDVDATTARATRDQDTGRDAGQDD